MSQQPSGYGSLDFLNTSAAINSGGQSPVRDPSRFSSALNSINRFLATATNTIVTVDGVINKGDGDGYQSGRQTAGKLQAGLAQPGGNTLKMLAVAGVAVGGSVLAYRTFKK